MKQTRMNRHGEPFGSIQAAKLGASHLLKNEHLESIPVPIEGGFGLEVEVEEGAITKEAKPERIPIGTRNILTIPKRKGYKRRCVNIDEAKAGWDRIEQFQAAGYSIVEGDVEIGNDRIADQSKMGSAAIRPVGGGMKGIWMEIKEEWHQEDQMEKLAKIDEKEAGMVVNEQNPGEGMYGKVQIAPSG